MSSDGYRECNRKATSKYRSPGQISPNAATERGDSPEQVLVGVRLDCLQLQATTYLQSLLLPTPASIGSFDAVEVGSG